MTTLKASSNKGKLQVELQHSFKTGRKAQSLIQQR